MKRTAVPRAIACIGLLALSGSIAGAQQQQQQPQPHSTRANLNGEWVGSLELEGGTHNLSLVFNITDSTFAGAVYDEGHKFGDMEAGTLSGDTVRFKLDYLAFTGVIKGTKMNIALIVYNGSTRNFIVTKKSADKGGLDERGD